MNLDKLIDKITAFGEDRTPRPSYWFRHRGIEICVRNGFHLIDGTARHTLDIVNVTITPSGKGTFTKLLEQLERIETPTGILYIENVQTECFANFFLKRGYTEAQARGLGGTPCFYKRIPSYHAN